MALSSAARKPRRGRFYDHFVRRQMGQRIGLFHHRLAAQFPAAGLWVRVATGCHVPAAAAVRHHDQTKPGLA